VIMTATMLRMSTRSLALRKVSPLPFAMREIRCFGARAAGGRVYFSSKPPPAEEPAEKGATADGEECASDGPNDEVMRGRVLEAAMRQVDRHGWTVSAITAGAAACGLSPMAHGLLPRGPIELVEHFSATCDAKLAAELHERAAELEGLEVHNRLLVAMQARLRMMAPYSATWPQALALRALPANLPNTLRDGHSLAQQLLDACGEDGRTPLVPQPIDPLVKAMSVGAIYGAAELHLLTDRSPELSDTWTFVEREVNALRSVANVKSRLSDLSPANLILSLLARPR